MQNFWEDCCSKSSEKSRYKQSSHNSPDKKNPFTDVEKIPSCPHFTISFSRYLGWKFVINSEQNAVSYNAFVAVNVITNQTC